MKNLLDILLAIIFLLFSFLIWIFNYCYPTRPTDIKEWMHLVVFGVLLVSFIIMYSIYISHSRFILLSMLTMFLSTLLWSSGLKNALYLIGSSSDVYINTFGFIIMLSSFILTFHQKLKNA